MVRGQKSEVRSQRSEVSESGMTLVEVMMSTIVLGVVGDHEGEIGSRRSGVGVNYGFANCGLRIEENRDWRSGSRGSGGCGFRIAD